MFLKPGLKGVVWSKGGKEKTIGLVISYLPIERKI